MMNIIQNCSVPEKEKLEDTVDCDQLSDLPLGIIHIILAFLPIRDVVRTSVLSTQWRYKWTTLPQLAFDDRCLNQERESDFTIGDIITQVLFHHKGPIHSFSTCCPGHLQNLDEWIYCLARNDIRELNIDNNCWSFDCEVEVRSNIYLCKKLTCLGLYGCALNPLPLTFNGYLSLRCLRLTKVGMTSDEIYRLVAVCPHLEFFEFIDGEGLELKISAPNLKYMNISGCHEKISISAPLMTEISVDLGLNDVEGPDAACDYAKCLGGFSNLQKLFGSCDFIRCLSFDVEFCHRYLVFHHLKVLHLHGVSSKYAKEMTVVAHLVIGAPNLQELLIGIEQCPWEDDVPAPDLSFRDLGCASNFKLEKLTDVSLYNASGITLEAEFLKFLLESSPALETMSIGLRQNTEENRNDLRAKLEGCNWASPTVKLCDEWKVSLFYNEHWQAFRRVFLFSS